jgi:hypothetical protein
MYSTSVGTMLCSSSSATQLAVRSLTCMASV